MSLLVWNCRGLGNLRIGKELGVLIRAKDPSVVFLVETWADEARLKEIQRNIKFDNLFYMDRNPRGGGGLALYWKNSFDVHVDSFSKYHIDSIINKGSDEAWRFIGFMESQQHTKELKLGTNFAYSIINMTFLGFVLETLMKSQDT